MAAPEKRDGTSFDYEELTARSREMYRFASSYLKYMKMPRDYLVKAGVSNTEVHILTMVVDHPGITVGEATKAWGCTSGAMSQMVTKLDGKGLITREKENGNAKTIHLYATEKGELLASEHKAYNYLRTLENVKEPTRDFTEEEKETFFKVLRAFAEVYEEKIRG